MRYRAISENVSRFPVSLMCRCLKVSKAGFYAWRDRPACARATANERLAVLIKGAHAQSRKTYGSPRIHATLRAEGITAGRHRIARLMRSHGIYAKTRRQFKATTQSNHDLPVAENILNRDFSVNRPDAACGTCQGSCRCAKKSLPWENKERHAVSKMRVGPSASAIRR